MKVSDPLDYKDRCPVFIREPFIKRLFSVASIFVLLFIAGLQSIQATPDMGKERPFFTANKSFLPPGVPDLSHPDTRLIIVVDSSIADNNANNQIVAHIVDSDGNPVPNVNVNFRWNPGTGDVTIGALTNSNGDALLNLASAIIGQIDVNARVGGILLTHNNPATVTFVAYEPDAGADETRLEVVADNALADNSSTNTIRAHVADANGNPVPNQSVSFLITSGTASFTTPVTVVTDANGDAFVSLRSNTVGEVTVIADVAGIPIVNGSPATVHFIADVPDVSVPTTFLEVTADGALANGAAANSVRAHITDAYGNPAANQTVTFVIASGTATPGGSLTVTTDASGDAVLTLTSLVAGTVTVTAEVNGTAIVNGSPATVEFVADVPNVSVPTTFLEVTADGAAADGAATNTVRAHITDANGNPAPGQSVTFAIATGTASFTTPVTVITDANGDALVSLSSTVIGEVAITAEVNGTAIVNGSPATVHFVADAPDVSVPTTFLEVTADGAAANGAATNSVRAHITDANGNPVSNQTVTFVIASGTATPVGSLTVTTDANGDAVLTLTSVVVGSVTITADVNGTAIVNGSPATVEFVVDVPSVSVPTTFIEVIADNALADGAATNTVRAHITDAQGNPVPGQSVTFAIATGTASFTTPVTVTTDVNGDAFVSLQSIVAGQVGVTATVNGTAIVNGSPAIVTFIADVPDVNNSATALVVDADNADADGVATNIVRAHIADANGNPVPNQTITFVITGGTATPGGPLTVTTDANGNAVLTLTSNVVGSVTVTADVNGTPIVNNSPATVNFVSFANVGHPATALIVDVNNAIADGADMNVVRAHVVDGDGNPLVNQEVVFTIASGDAVIVTAQPVMTDASGNAIIQLTSRTPGYVTITATAKNRPIVNGSPARIRFTEENIWVPKIFTPNGDGVNDVIRPIINGTFNFHFFNVYNRWGNLVFSTRDRNVGWDGRLKGVLQPSETYLWTIGGTDRNNTPVQRKGMFSLVR
ncbi:MAG TPA: Ig-like domain-containing protein [Flavitalea sp.]|nr:Ig-like domain-containing protein [Flavitalea sp.]